MARYQLTPRASQDLRDVWHTIAIDNERAADKLLMRIFDKQKLAAQHPKMGTARPELSDGPRAHRRPLYSHLGTTAGRHSGRGNCPRDARSGTLAVTRPTIHMKGAARGRPFRFLSGLRSTSRSGSASRPAWRHRHGRTAAAWPTGPPCS
ncbi:MULTISPECIES: type II toxin-antitoxin system RelE/ParE family toxin [unclassified Mesorhizobium]|uniref:type II toxin-antitoxin system RelE/ParE family toxin n=1 Tax=unclassified Mesorhizobium TaxID=325217 RepID=UPI0029621C55|nr:type II toxin-antitoxin system RelE/ParE family toxin [Mesorhizobium sp. ESP-6-2]